MILLYVEGEDVSQRLNNPICLDDKTDVGYPKNFQPKIYLMHQIILLIDWQLCLTKKKIKEINYLTVVLTFPINLICPSNNPFFVIGTTPTVDPVKT